MAETEQDGASVEDRARRVIGRVFWWNTDTLQTTAMSFKEICAVIREFDVPAMPRDAVPD